MYTETASRFFRHDAFISYAHADNTNGVVSALHDQLEEFLVSYLRREPSLWLDERSLNVDDDLEQQIRDGLRNAAVLIVVTSETIESRKWCRDEMSWFLTSANLDHACVQRMYPVVLPFNDVTALPRWADLSFLDAFVLDPNRQELISQQDYGAHREYWDRLYGWFSRVSQGIVAAHSVFEQFQRESRNVRKNG